MDIEVESWMVSSKSVVILGNYAPSLISFRGELMKAIVARGHHVTAIAPDLRDNVAAWLTENNIECCSFSLIRANINPFLDIYSLSELYSIFHSIKPDVLLSYTVKPVIYGSMAASLSKVPTICSMITGLGYAFGDNPGLQRRATGLAVRQLYRWALSVNSAVLFQNPDDLQLFKQNKLINKHTQAILINGSGVNLEEFHFLPPMMKPNFLMIARLIGDKGVREYAIAAKMLREIYPEARCRLVGYFDDTPDVIRRQELDEWVRAGDIEYLGQLDDVRSVLADCAVYVLPSYYREGTPRTILEAMATGRPIITTDTPGCRETVLNGVNGFLIPPRDPIALCTAMISFLENRSMVTSFGRSSRMRAEEKYDVKDVNITIIDALNL